MLRKRWTPQTKPQAIALNSTADILLYGGAAGGGKTEYLLVDAAAEFRNSNLRAILFRESFPQLRDIIRKAYRIYRRYPYFGKYNKTDHVWQFPSNAAELADPANIEDVASGKLQPVYIDGQCATVTFAFLENDDRCEDHQGQEYTWIGFDESTHHTEYQIQYLLTRLRSTDPTLFLRMRLATNPGGSGHRFHQKVFIGPVCPHCQPNSPLARKPFLIYKDAAWTDGTPLTQIIDGVEVIYTTQFIPAKLTDHNLFGNGNVKYKAQLRMQRPSTAKALEEGCWALFEGQYFDVFEENRGMYYDTETGAWILPPEVESGEMPDMRMVVTRKEIDAQFWWPHFLGGDYGFTISQTAAYLCMRTPASSWFPNGRIYVLDEFCAPRVTAEDFAKFILERWFLVETTPGRWVVPENPIALQMMALSPDAFNQTGHVGDNGVSISRADQMNAKLSPYGLGFTRASNDRAGGWQHIYSILRSGELVICGDTCPKLVEAIPSRVHDPKKPDDIEKIPGDELDDCMDAIRYALYSWFKVGAKPLSLEIAERMAAAPDPTNAMITRAKIAEEVTKRSAPIFVGRGAKLKQQMWMRSRRRP